MPSPARPKSPRQVALAILNRIAKDQSYANILLRATFVREKGLTTRDRALITELVYGTLRWQGKIDWVLSQHCQRPLSKFSREILNILRLGAYQLLMLERVPDFAAVNEAVGLARHIAGISAAGLVNAILRAVARSRGQATYPDRKKEPVSYIASYYSQPAWLVKILLNQYGLGKTLELSQALNQRPPLTLRVNSLKTSREELLVQLKKEVREATPTLFSSRGIIVAGTAQLENLPSYKKGLFVVQDEAAQLVTQVLDPRSGERLRDACAAPGGKAIHTAQLMGNTGLILALDLSHQKLALAAKECRRLGITNIRFLAADSTQPLPFRLKFHRIIIDAPCSGTGVIRRHPEGKWLEPDIPHLVQLQHQLLTNLAAYLAPGGIMVYTVCSLLHQEGEEVIARFLKKNKNFQLDVNLPEKIRPALVVAGGSGSASSPGSR